MNETISIILPVLAAEENLDRCVGELLAQTCPPRELILADGAGVCGGLRDADSRIRVISGTYGSVTEAALAGAAAAEGEILGFADAGTRIEPELYESLRRLMEEKNADIAIARNRVMPEPARIENADGELSDEPVDPIPRWDTLFGARKAIYDMVVDNRVQGVMWDKLFRRSLFDGLAAADGGPARDEALLASLFRRAGAIAQMREPMYERQPEPEGRDLRAGLDAVLLQQERILLTDDTYPGFQPGIWPRYHEAMETLVLRALEADREEGMRYRSLLSERLWPFYRDRGMQTMGSLSRQKRMKYRILLSRPDLFWRLWPAIRRVKSALIHD